VGSSIGGAGGAVRWVGRSDWWELLDNDDQILACAWPCGAWRAYGGGIHVLGRADPPTLEAAKAVVEAELWARAARALGG